MASALYSFFSLPRFARAGCTVIEAGAGHVKIKEDERTPKKERKGQLKRKENRRGRKEKRDPRVRGRAWQTHVAIFCGRPWHLLGLTIYRVCGPRREIFLCRCVSLCCDRTKGPARPARTSLCELVIVDVSSSRASLGNSRDRQLQSHVAVNLNSCTGSRWASSLCYT